MHSKLSIIIIISLALNHQKHDFRAFCLNKHLFDITLPLIVAVYVHVGHIKASHKWSPVIGIQEL